jgi:dimethylargininase
LVFTRAIVRPPSASFAEGLTTSGLGKPDLSKALDQHGRYCATLEQCGLTLTRLPADAAYPDSTFVEDTAILTERCAVLTRPGAASRAGEVANIGTVLPHFYSRIHEIAAPGTVDGGDVCQADSHFFIGISERTNAEGARQLAQILTLEGFTSTAVDIRGAHGILHLKSGISYLGDKRLVVIDALAGDPAFSGYEILHLEAEENYAANFLLIKDHLIVSDGFPQFASMMSGFGLPVIALDMSEFRKMDGALSCLSLRF